MEKKISPASAHPAPLGFEAGRCPPALCAVPTFNFVAAPTLCAGATPKFEIWPRGGKATAGPNLTLGAFFAGTAPMESLCITNPFPPLGSARRFGDLLYIIYMPQLDLRRTGQPANRPTERRWVKCPRAGGEN